MEQVDTIEFKKGSIYQPAIRTGSGQQLWQRVVLLMILGYEAAGCLLGGILLVAAPNGSLMDMPVQMMHAVFPDFLIPGVILTGLGILNTLAFISVIRQKKSDWVMAGLALGGLFIWFVVEIFILQELHWLHLMWGYPVLLGWVVAIPLIVLRNNTSALKKGLLACGILSSLWYVGINVFVPTHYAGYSMMSLTVSELSAFGAPTRILWFLMCVYYPMLILFFGWGVLYSARENRYLRLAGIFTIAYSVLNFYWPPMHQREVIAAGGGTITDTMHIAWAMMTLLFNIILMWFGFVASAKWFRSYTIATWIVFIVCGVLTFKESAGIEANLPTPYIGLWERLNMGAFLLWIILFAVSLLLRKSPSQSVNGYSPISGS